MFKKIVNKWYKFRTKNYTKIPLFVITFDYPKYKEFGDKDSCTCHMHPDFQNDQLLKDMIGDVIDYIRDNYDMEQFTKI